MVSGGSCVGVFVSFTSFSDLCELAASESTNFVNGTWYIFILMIMLTTSSFLSKLGWVGANETVSFPISSLDATIFIVVKEAKLINFGAFPS